MASAPVAPDGANAQGHISALRLTVLRQAAQGFSIDEIAAVLALEPAEVRHALLSSMRQLGAHTKLQAIVRAAARGLPELGSQTNGSR